MTLLTTAESGLPESSGHSALSCVCGMPRRGFLTGLAALGAGAVLPGCAGGGAALSQGKRIDIHHHLFSPAYVAELARANQAPPIITSW